MDKTNSKKIMNKFISLVKRFLGIKDKKQVEFTLMTWKYKTLPSCVRQKPIAFLRDDGMIFALLDEGILVYNINDLLFSVITTFPIKL